MKLYKEKMVNNPTDVGLDAIDVFNLLIQK